jgi:hypothetical protein
MDRTITNRREKEEVRMMQREDLSNVQIAVKVIYLNPL